MVARILAAALTILSITAVADAGCPPTRRVVVQQPVVLAQQILVPSYGGSYSPQPAQQQDDLMRRLVEVLERLEGRLEAPAGGYTAEAVLKLECATCHTEGKAKGGFMLFDKEGKALDLSLGDQKLVKLRITTTDTKQRMPPERPLTQTKQSVILQSLKGG